MVVVRGHASLCSLADQYDNPMSYLTIYLSQGLRIWPLLLQLTRILNLKILKKFCFIMILFIWQTVQSTPSVTAYYLFYGINIRRSMNMLL
jgi:hypothetical protein